MYFSRFNLLVNANGNNTRSFLIEEAESHVVIRLLGGFFLLLLLGGFGGSTTAATSSSCGRGGSSATGRHGSKLLGSLGDQLLNALAAEFGDVLVDVDTDGGDDCGDVIGRGRSVAAQHGQNVSSHVTHAEKLQKINFKSQGHETCYRL